MSGYNNAKNNVNYNTPVTLSSAADVTATLSDYIIAVNDTSAARTVTLPAPSTAGSLANTGKVYIIKDQSGAASIINITVTPASGTIDGQASVVISEDFGMLQVYSDGTNWFVGSRQVAPPPKFTWSIESTGTPLSGNRGYISTANTTQYFPIPTICPLGSFMEITQKGDGMVVITQHSGQNIRLGNAKTLTGFAGSLVSRSKGNALKLVCTVANTEFQAVTGYIGNWVII